MKEHPDRALKREVDFLLSNLDKVYAEQTAERQAFLSDPANAEAVSRARAGIMVAVAVRKARKACHLSQARLAEKLNKKPSYIARLERGGGGALTLKALSEIAAACGKRLKVSFM
jgi:ribosome-binding protein aMBF1 (putative translation factor)